MPVQVSPKPKTFDELMGASLVSTLDRLDLLSRKLLAGKLPGERRSKRRGRSVEFADFRPYVPGDDLRHIDWNIVGRLDKLFIKIFREEEDLSLHIILDASASMDAAMSGDEPSKLVFAARLGAALAYLGLANQNRVTLSAVGLPARDETPSNLPLRRLAAMRGRSNIRIMGDFVMDVLQDAARAPATPSQDVIERQTQALRTLGTSSAGRGICVYISDMLVPEAAMQGLSYLVGGAPGTYDTWCLQVLSPGEIDPSGLAARGLVGDLRLTDAETSKALEVTISPASIAQYKAGLQRHIDAVKRACLSRGIAHALLPTDAKVEDVLLGTLRKGGLLR